MADISPTRHGKTAVQYHCHPCLLERHLHSTLTESSAIIGGCSNVPAVLYEGDTGAVVDMAKLTPTRCYKTY